jgi:acetoin utilization deacetylase AcuC-like enzyme
MDLIAAGRARRVLIVDLDVHHGDGTATIFADEPRVFTLSVHGAGNFPKEKPPSDLDVGLPDGTADDAYLAAVAAALSQAFERSNPDFVFYQAGVDPLQGDRFGRLALSHAGLFQRDRRVFQACHDRRIPVVWTMGGGYAKPVSRTIEAHLGTWRAAMEVLG